MGRRSAGAAFMPSKFVFPGGAVDAADHGVPLEKPVSASCLSKLREGADAPLAHGLQAAAIRETWEETGLILGTPGGWPDPMPANWAGFAATGHRPSAEGFRFIFRAITPPGRPRRFDARFFLADAAAIRCDPDDFSRASGELSQLRWVTLEDVRRHDLPFITQVVLTGVAGICRTGTQTGGVPFFSNDDERGLFRRLGGKSPPKNA